MIATDDQAAWVDWHKPIYLYCQQQSGPSRHQIKANFPKGLKLLREGSGHQKLLLHDKQLAYVASRQNLIVSSDLCIIILEYNIKQCLEEGHHLIDQKGQWVKPVLFTQLQKKVINLSLKIEVVYQATLDWLNHWGQTSSKASVDAMLLSCAVKPAPRPTALLPGNCVVWPIWKPCQAIRNTKSLAKK